MINKTYNSKKTNCKVTFRYQPEESAEEVQLLGDFNQWGEKKRQFLKKRKDGSFSLTLNLKPNQSYQFRYLVDGSWVTDVEADNMIWNSFGSQNALVEV